MADKIIMPQNRTENLQSGPEIVKDFVRGLPSVPGLDGDTVEAIMTLHASGRLTTNALLRELESRRGTKLDDPPATP
jgi:hypothetical protein